MAWQTVTRNMTNIQHQNIRERIDSKFNDVHDRLSAAYYDGGVFTQSGHTWNFGALKASDPANAKAVFEKLHSLIFYVRDVVFNQTNLALPKNQRIPVDQYDTLKDDSGNVIGSKATLAQTIIDTLKTEGIELVI